jgi:hypothetical protein
MIKIEIDGSVSRSFIFPADFKTAFEFYRDLGKITSWLEHIKLIAQHGPNQYRMLYHSTELGIYRVNIYCDLFSAVDKKEPILRVAPLHGIPPVKAEASMNTLTAQGFYSSESTFHEDGEQTKIDYTLSLRARLPIPFGARIIPVSVLDLIAQNV